jgi:L-ascorbate metabolism protein UlaG (beta-lactamase superfamily)
MEPSAAPAREPARTVKLELPFAAVKAFRTFHGRGHNSYLIESAGLRFFHDGDNGNTTRIPASALGRIDALMIGPWQGSGWVEFIEKLSPSRYFLMHLSEEELDEHEAGRFLPGICARVPKGLVVLRPGQSFSFATR